MKIVYYKNPESEYRSFDDIVSSGEADVVLRCFDSESELSYIDEHRPDIIIFEDSAIPFAISAFLELIPSDETYSPKVLVHHPETRTFNPQNSSPEPFGKFGIVDLVESEYDCTDDYGKCDMKSLVSGILSELGISVHISGYRYLRKAVLISLYNPSAVKNITKDIYTVIEKYFRVSRGTAERAMRHAIESVWDKSDSIHLRFYFSRRKKPTNSLFISIVSEDIRNHYEKEIANEIEIRESCRKYARRKKKLRNK